MREHHTNMWLDADFERRLASRGISTFGDLLTRDPDLDLNKEGLPSWRQRVMFVLDDGEAGTKRIYVKRFHRPPLASQWRRITSGNLMRSTAGIEKRWIDELDAAGISVPQVVAFGENRQGCWEKASALALLEVPGKSLERWVLDHPGRAPRRMIEALGEFTRRFHDGGYIHRDFYLCHIFFVHRGTDLKCVTESDFVLIDLQRIMKDPWRRTRWIVRELAQLNYSTPETTAGLKERLRFLKSYLGCARFDRAAIRKLISQINRKTRRIAAHDRRRRLQSSSARGGAL